MNRELSRQLAQHTVTMAQAAHRTNLEGITDELINVHLPKLVNEKMLPMREAFAGMLSKLSNDVEAQAFPDVRAEVRVVAKEFIWANIRKTTEVKTFEDRLDKLEGRVTDLANENNTLKQRCVDVNEFNALKQKTSELESKLDVTINVIIALQSRIATLETDSSGLQQRNAILTEKLNVVLNYVRVHQEVLNYPHVPDSS